MKEIFATWFLLTFNAAETDKGAHIVNIEAIHSIELKFEQLRFKSGRLLDSPEINR
jgi:hypothetical protein